MLKQAKILNEETKLCSVILGNATDEFLKTNNYTEQDVSLSDIDNEWYLTPYCKMKSEEQKAQEEQERINELFLTRADVFKAILLAQNITRNDLKELITRNETVPMLQKELALIDFEEALNFYRKNPLIDIIGNSLGIDKIHLNNFFVKGNNEETKSEAWKELVVEPEPSETPIIE